MKGENQPSVVLPDTLVVKLINDAASVAGFLNKDFAEVASKRQQLRDQLVGDRKIVEIDYKGISLEHPFVIDGAHIVEVDRASAYSISCGVQLGREQSLNNQMSCLAILPHTVGLNALSSGLMLMQEVMLSVGIVENNEKAISFIDGSRISAVIAINSFYSGIARDLPDQLRIWREQSQREPEREPGKTLGMFESRDWLRVFLTHPRIVGNLKLVTTHSLIDQYIPEWAGRFDDKTLAALTLEPTEAFEAIPIPSPSEPYHTNKSYPGYKDIDAIQANLTAHGHPMQILQTYYRPKESHGIFKIEFNRTLLDNKAIISSVFDWWQDEVLVPDIQEPYSYYLADRFAKEAASTASAALKEIARRNQGENEWAWYLTQSYRTE